MIKNLLRLLAVVWFVAIFTIQSVAAPVTTHPRLWITTNDLPRLRNWAAPTNPMWNALSAASTQAVQTYDSLFYPGGIENTNWPDHGTTNWEPYPVEAYAQFFAFLSLIDPNTTNRVQHAQRARNLLMHGIHEALKGQAPHDAQGNEVPYRDQFLMTYNRANYWGECWGTTVDWLQASGALSAQDLSDIRTVFLRWCQEMLSGYNHPLPIGMVNDPQLLADTTQLRAALNNYFTGHMRNITLCALSLDAPDDPAVNPALPDTALGNTLRSYITNSTGAWLYQQYAVYENSNTVAATFGVPAKGMGVGEGGLSVEGFLYGHAFGYLSEALLGLKTAGYHDETLSGPQIRLITSRFWDDFADGFLASLTPQQWVDPTRSYLGPLYQFASYGDVLRFWITPDHADTFGSLGVLDEILGNTNRLNKDRWIVQNAIEGGAGGLVSRTSNIWGNANTSRAILHFLLFDPTATTAADPRPALPLDFHAPAIGRLLSRTDWTTNCSWFNFKCTYISINHQIGDGGQFEFFRKGEWLCKELSGYTSDNLGSCPEFHNTLGLENTSTAGTNSTPSALQWYESYFPSHGSQWKEGLCAGDPITYASFGANYTYAFAEMTNLYNRPSFTPDSDFRDITQANRSIIWLKPDHIVVYDRATSKTANRFKRWFLQTLTTPAINGNVATSTSANGQNLFIKNLLPSNAILTTSPAVLYRDQAEGEPPTQQLMIEDPTNPSDVRFLNVLQGADSGAAQDAPSFVQSSAGHAFEGTQVKNFLVLFPKNVLQGNFSNVIYVVATNINQHFLSGLPAYAGYDVATSVVGTNFHITISSGGTTYFSDRAGVLSFIPNVPPPTFALTVVNGSGGGNHPANAAVTITASGAPIGQVFANWSGASVAQSNSSTTTLFMPASNITVTANFATAYTLSVTNGTGGGSYPAGAQITITANAPSFGQVFDQWVGAPVANAFSSTTTLTMPATNASITATYKAAPTVTLTVINGSGTGSYLAGTVVSITANSPPAGQTFDQWVGASVSNAFSATTSITMPSTNVTVTASFKAAPVNYYSLTVVNGSGSGSYAAGSTVTIIANPPGAGLVFDKWTGASVNPATATNSTLIMPSANTVVTAVYKAAVDPSWELWADRSNGLVSGGTLSLAINTSHEIFYTFWNSSPTGVGRVYKNTFASPHSFSLLATNGFNIDKTVQQNVGDLALSSTGDPVAAISSTVGSTIAPVNWFYKFNPLLNGGTGGWSAASLVANGSYFYNVRAIENDPVTGMLSGVGESPALWVSTNGSTFTALDQQGKLPNDLRGGGPPKTREFTVCMVSPTSRYPQGLIFTAGENNGLVYTPNQGTNWFSVDPDYLNPISPLARAHAAYDLTISNQVASGCGDTGGLGWRPEGRVLHQSPSAFGYGGTGLNGTGGSDATRLYSFLLNRPDLPDLLASGIPNETFAGGQGVQSQTLRTTTSGWTFIESPIFPANGQGGIYMTRDGIRWTSVNTGIGYAMNPKTSGGISSGGRSSLAVEEDDVFMAANSAIYHYVAPGTNCVSGTIRDIGNQPLGGVIVSTIFGNWTVSAADGRYSITNVGNSLYPVTIIAKAPGLAFPRQPVMVVSAVNNLNFTAATPILTSISVTPTTNTVVAGGTTFFSAIAQDQFGMPLSPQPVLVWNASSGVITSNGFFTAPAPGPNTNVISVVCSNVTGTAVAIGATNALPFITAISTNSGSVLGGTSVTITGGNFPTNGVVLFGGVVAAVSSITNNSIICTTPNMSRSPTYGSGGMVPVSITTASGSGATLNNAFNCLSAPSQTFFATIIAGTTSGQTQISAVPGATLSLVAAAAPAGQTFYAWSGGGNGSFGNVTASNTTFVMPAHDVTIVATYKKLPTLPTTATPSFSLSSGPTSDMQQIAISCVTSNADIYFTLDYSDPVTPTITPNPNGYLYTGPFLIPANTTVKAIASAANRPDSAIMQTTFSLPPIEVWRATNFGTNAQNPNIGGDAADPDGDGVANLFEYAFGLDPNVSLQTNLPSPTITSVSNSDYLTIHFFRDTRATDLTMTVQVSIDLTNWISGSIYSPTNVVPITPNTIEVSRNGTPIESIVVRDASPTTNAPVRFMRVKTALTP